MGLRKPKWFCGDAKDWALLSPKVMAVKFRQKTNNRLTSALEGLIIGGVMILGTTSGGEMKELATPDKFAFIAEVTGLLFCGLSTFLGGFTENFVLKPSHIISSVGDAVTAISKRGLSETKTLKEISKAALAASKEGKDNDDNYTSEGTAALQVHEVVETEIERRVKKGRNNEAAQTQEMRMAQAARRAAPDGFANMKEDEWKPTTVEARLGKIKELGADGMAAVSLALGMIKEGRVDKLEKSELKRIVEDNIPKLLDAWESVPESDRKKVHEVLGDTPENALTRGLSAALTRVLEIRTALSTRSRTAIEAEARVLEAKSGPMTP